MAQRGLSKVRFARAAGVDERTVQRWLSGDKPQVGTARSAANALDCEPGDIWPDLFPVMNPSSGGTVPVSVYSSRAHVPVHVWLDLFADAKQQIDVCVYGGTFLFDTVPGFNRLMRNAASRGVTVRFIAGDPGSTAVHQRGEEEKIGTSLSGRCALTLDRLAPLSGIAGIEIRVHRTPLYVSMFRCDDNLIANHHIYGSPASDNPSLVIPRSADPDLWDKYEVSFNEIWAGSQLATYPKGS